jgi:hypothetical protein
MQTSVKPHLPQVKPADPEGRTEFASFRDLFTYLEQQKTSTTKEQK